MADFNVGDRVRYVREDGFAGKITDRCWMPDSNPWRLAPDGVVMKVTHVPEGEERYLGWEFATRPARPGTHRLTLAVTNQRPGRSSSGRWLYLWLQLRGCTTSDLERVTGIEPA